MTDTPGITGHWDLDPAHSRLGFSTRHAMVSRVRGAFNDVSGFADITDDYSTSQASVVMKTKSIDTRSDDRDKHLRSADFFDVETYPEIRFISSAIDEVDENSFVVTGELSIRDVTKTVSIPLELIGIDKDPFGNLRAGLEGSRRIDRKDWGVRWNANLDSGGVLVSDKITLEFELSLVKKIEEEVKETAPEPVQETAPAATTEPVQDAELVKQAPPVETSAPVEPSAPANEPAPAKQSDGQAPPPLRVKQAETSEPAGQPARAEQSERAAEQILPPPPIKPTAGQ